VVSVVPVVLVVSLALAALVVALVQAPSLESPS
jgi:hypothetical protein